MRPFRFVVVLCVLLSLVLPSAAQDSPLTVIATTSIITDIAKNVGGDLVVVQSLVPPESDIHAFQPRPSDLRLLADADIVLANGLGLEGFLNDMIAAADVTPEIVTDGIALITHDNHEIIACDEDNAAHEEENHDEHDHEAEHGDEVDHDEHEHGECDPHIWQNPNNVIVMVENITAIFVQYDPDNAEIYSENSITYIAELEALDSEIETLLSAIPADERLLVTNHQFLGYFAERYNFTVIGTVIPGVSTLAEPTPRELAELSQQIQELGVPAIFIEIAATEGLSQALLAEIGDSVQIVGLYSDALSVADGAAPTYLDMMRFNARAIADVFDS